MSKDRLKKMKTELCDEVKYFLEINNETHNMNEMIDKNIIIKWNGKVICKAAKEMKKF